VAGRGRQRPRATGVASDRARMMRLRLFVTRLAAWPRHVASWLGERFELEDSVLAVLRHPVPRELERPVGWWYVFGSATLAVFVVQVATGVGLAMTYVPAPNSAYDSLQFISHDATLGAVVRGIHYFGAGAMVVLVLIHMTQVYLFGAFKFPREANWLSGSLLLLAVLAMAFTGQLLRWDQDAFWSLVVADPRPDWYFLGYFALLALIPPATEAIVIIGLPLLAFVFLFLVPIFWPDGERHWSRRPVAIAAVALPFIAYASLTVAGLQSPWVPLLEGANLPTSVTAGLEPQAARGAQLF